MIKGRYQVAAQSKWLLPVFCLLLDGMVLLAGWQAGRLAGWLRGQLAAAFFRWRG